MTPARQALELARAINRAAESVKAIDIKTIDVTGRLAITDLFVVASGGSERQVGAIVDRIEEQVTKLGANPRREGQTGARWVLLDFGDVVAHVFHADDRAFYGLEGLWRDCPEIDLDKALEQDRALAAVGE